MTRLTLAAYRLFKRYRAVFYLILIGSFALWLFLASRMYYEEDISKLLPSSGSNEGTRFAFNQLKVKDKIFLEFRLKDGAEGKAASPFADNLASSSNTADLLIEATDSFCERLLAEAGLPDGAENEESAGTGDIDNLLYRIDNNMLYDAAQFVLDNAPVFLSPEFYTRLENRLTPQYADSVFMDNLRLLESEAGDIYYDIICQDPLAFRNLAMGEATGSADFNSAVGGASIKIIGSHFFTPDSTMSLAFLTPAFKSMDSKAGTRLVDNILKHIETFEQEHPQVEVLFYGAPVQSVFNSKRIKKDLIFTVGIALLVIVLIIGLCFKGLRSITYLVLPIIYGVVFAIAMLYLIQGQMSFIALGIGSIVVGVGLSYCLHVIVHYKYISDIEQVIKDQTRPVLLGCITTVGSLLGLIFTRSALLRDFGIMASLVMVGTTLFALFFLPQFFTPAGGRKSARAFSLIEKITTYPYWQKRPIIVTVILLFAASLVITKGKASFDTNIVNIGYFEPKVALADSLYNQKVTGGLEQEYYAVFARSLDSALHFNKGMEQLCKKLKEDGIITSYSNSASLLLPSDEQQKRIELWRNYFTPERQLETGRLIRHASAKAEIEDEIFEPFFNSMSKEFTPVNIYRAGIIEEGILSNLIEYTDSTYLVFTSVTAHSKEDITAASKFIASGGKATASTQAEEDNLKDNLLVVNPFFYTTDMLDIMNHDFTTVLLVSSLFVFVILLIAMRNVLLAIIAFLPMGMSWYIVLGVMAIAGVQFNLINIVISTFIFGMGVDYSIFVMDGLMHPERGELLKYHRTAIFFSAVVLIIGIASLMFAKHPALASVGLSTLAGMVSTILITFTLQPYLYNKLMRCKYKSKGPKATN